jgi:hypothetical protein
MRTSGATALDSTNRRGTERMTPAQWYALAVGVTLLLVGIFGFFADSTFDTGVTNDPEGGNVDGALQGDSFLGFEVNGWHNIVHLASGLFLLSIFKRRDLARKGVLAFGLLYGLVTIIGMIDGNDVLGIFPINPADNVLHLVLSLAAIASALVSRPDHGIHGERTIPHTKADQAGHGDLGTTTGDRTGRTVAPGQELRGRTRDRL